MQRVYWRAAGVLATMLSLAACAGPRPIAVPPTVPPSQPGFSSAADQICRGYAARQKAQEPGLMYAQCMYARGYLVSGFSPSPDTPGYQGPLLGPATIGGGN